MNENPLTHKAEYTIITPIIASKPSKLDIERLLLNT